MQRSCQDLKHRGICSKSIRCWKLETDLTKARDLLVVQRARLVQVHGSPTAVSRPGEGDPRRYCGNMASSCNSSSSLNIMFARKLFAPISNTRNANAMHGKSRVSQVGPPEFNIIHAVTARRMNMPTVIPATA